MLAEPARSAWAKSWPMGVPDDQLEGWLPLWRHLDDALAVAGQVWGKWAAPSVQRLIADAVGGAVDARSLYLWLASVHDIGKVTPAFAVQVPRFAHDMSRAGLPMSDHVFERQRARHELAGQLLIEHWLQDRLGFSAARARNLAVVVGGHHGSPPSQLDLAGVDGVDSLVGGHEWLPAQREILDRQLLRSGAEQALAAVRERALPQPVQAALMGLVIFADWLASNPRYFPLVTPGLQPHDDPAERESEAEQCWAAVGFPERWQPDAPPSDTSAFFGKRFANLGAPRPVQAEAVALAHTMDPHGILVVEAPMGEGKTEAALLAAEILAYRSGAAGVYIALPTQATANSMYARTCEWARHLPGGTRTVHLAHGKAWLNERFDQLLNAVSPIGQDEPPPAGRGDRARDDGSQITALRWLAGRYRAGLADIVVGTIDQVLMAALQAKFVAMRQLALAGKVVILDEVHAVDVYMSMYLEMALEWLGAYGAPVILLSATLPPSHRRRLLAAYRRGAEQRTAPASKPDSASAQDGPPSGFGYVAGGRRAAAAPPPTHEDDDDPAYPVLTAVAADGQSLVRRALQPSGRSAIVRIDQLPDDLGALAALLKEALAEGGCALVLRDTVSRVHQTAEYLRGVPELADAVRIAHAQFLAIDRVRLDRALVDDFGPDATRENGKRPERAIVIATQVVEQSLDVDFDLLVTDIAPVDLVLQRLGRIHRHAGRNRPAPVATPRAYVTGFAMADDGPRFPRGVTYVYDEYLLTMALDALAPRFGGAIELPGDIAALVRLAYSEGADLPPVVPQWAERIAALREKHARNRDKREASARTFRLPPPQAPGEPLSGWVSRGLGSVDESATGQAQVRDGTDSIEVIVVTRGADGQLRIPDWIDDGRRGQLVSADLPLSPADARALARCALRLPFAMTVGPAFDRVVGALERNYFDGWQFSQHLKGELVLVLDQDRHASLAGFDISYSPQQGLKVVKGE